MIKKLEQALKENPNLSIFGIRYFSGLERFCNNVGEYMGNSLEQSLEKFLKEKHEN